MTSALRDWRARRAKSSRRAGTSERSRRIRSSEQTGFSPRKISSLCPRISGRSTSIHCSEAGSSMRYGRVSNPAARLMTMSPPSGLDLAILAPRSPASRRAKGSRKSASGRSDSTARARATRRAVSDTLRMRPSSDAAAFVSEGALLRSGSCMRGPYLQANLIADFFDLSRQLEGILYPLALICAELMRGDSARGGSRGTGGGGENQIREKLAEAAAGDLEFQIARGAVQPAEIDEQGDFGPGFRSFRREANVAQHAGNMGGAFFLDAGNARGDALVR